MIISSWLACWYLSPYRFPNTPCQAEYLGDLSANPFGPNSTANPFGGGNPFSPNSITNDFGPYGNPFSKRSATNPFATNAPRLYDQQGNYRGKLSANPYDPDSTSDPFGSLRQSLLGRFH
jgi:hypothetical protein